jgi:multidrug resistance efflux pump
MKLFYTVFGASLLVLCAVTLYIRSDADSFFGIADTREIIVSSEKAVEIKKIHVFPGQIIKKGDTIAELVDPELTLKINYVGHQLEELTKQNTAHTNLSRSEMQQFKAEKNARISGLNAQIQELQMQYETNRSLLLKLRSIDTNEANSVESEKSPIAIKIRQLKEELNLALDSAHYMESKLHNSLSYAGDPLAEKVKGFQSDLALLMDEKSKLLMLASIDGVIGSVGFKDGEKVSPFDTIATIHNETPSYVNGYIPENVYTAVMIGMPVNITSVNKKNSTVTGSVIGVGSRIVEYPVRLRRYADVQMWGRDVIIKIPECNKYILGEKVRIVIKPAMKKSGFASILGL